MRHYVLRAADATHGPSERHQQAQSFVFEPYKSEYYSWTGDQNTTLHSWFSYVRAQNAFD